MIFNMSEENNLYINISRPEKDFDNFQSNVMFEEDEYITLNELVSASHSLQSSDEVVDSLMDMPCTPIDIPSTVPSENEKPVKETSSVTNYLLPHEDIQSQDQSNQKCWNFNEANEETKTLERSNTQLNDKVTNILTPSKVPKKRGRKKKIVEGEINSQNLVTKQVVQNVERSCKDLNYDMIIGEDSVEEEFVKRARNKKSRPKTVDIRNKVPARKKGRPPKKSQLNNSTNQNGTLDLSNVENSNTFDALNVSQSVKKPKRLGRRNKKTQELKSLNKNIDEGNLTSAITNNPEISFENKRISACGVQSTNNNQEKKTKSLRGNKKQKISSEHIDNVLEDLPLSSINRTKFEDVQKLNKIGECSTKNETLVQELMKEDEKEDVWDDISLSKLKEGIGNNAIEKISLDIPVPDKINTGQCASESDKTLLNMDKMTKLDSSKHDSSEDNNELDSVHQIEEENLLEVSSKRPVRKRIRKTFQYEEESDEDPFANMESSDDEPKRVKKGKRYYSDDEYIPAVQHIKRRNQTSDTEIDEDFGLNKKQKKKKCSKSPKKKDRKCENVNQSDDIESSLEMSVIKLKEDQSSSWGNSNEFQKFLAKKISGTDIFIKKGTSENAITPLQIPVLDLNEPKKFHEISTQTNKLVTKSAAAQTDTLHSLPMKDQIKLTAEQSEKACEFLSNIVRTTAELGQLMTEKSENFIEKKINTVHVTDTFKMDYCVKKSFLLFKLAKHNLMQMEEDLAKQYNEFLKDQNLMQYREQQKIIMSQAPVSSDSDCEIVETSDTAKQNEQKKSGFNTKKVFLNKELSIKITKKATEPKLKENVKGKHTVWINDSIMIKKVKPNQSFLAQDSRNKKPPDVYVTLKMVNDFFETYERHKALSICAGLITTDWMASKSLFICGYFTEVLHGTSKNIDLDTIQQPINDASESHRVGTPKSLLTLCIQVLRKTTLPGCGKQKKLHMSSMSHNNYMNSKNFQEHNKSPKSLLNICMQVFQRYPVTDSKQSYLKSEKPSDTVSSTKERKDINIVNQYKRSPGSLLILCMQVLQHYPIIDRKQFYLDSEKPSDTKSITKERKDINGINQHKRSPESLLILCMQVLQHYPIIDRKQFYLDSAKPSDTKSITKERKDINGINQHKRSPESLLILCMQVLQHYPIIDRKQFYLDSAKPSNTKSITKERKDINGINQHKRSPESLLILCMQVLQHYLIIDRKQFYFNSAKPSNTKSITKERKDINGINQHKRSPESLLILCMQVLQHYPIIDRKQFYLDSIKPSDTMFTTKEMKSINGLNQHTKSPESLLIICMQVLQHYPVIVKKQFHLEDERPSDTVSPTKEFKNFNGFNQHKRSPESLLLNCMQVLQRYKVIGVEDYDLNIEKQPNIMCTTMQEIENVSPIYNFDHIQISNSKSHMSKILCTANGCIKKKILEECPESLLKLCIHNLDKHMLIGPNKTSLKIGQVISKSYIMKHSVAPKPRTKQISFNLNELDKCINNEEWSLKIPSLMNISYRKVVDYYFTREQLIGKYSPGVQSLLSICVKSFQNIQSSYGNTEENCGFNPIIDNVLSVNNNFIDDGGFVQRESNAKTKTLSHLCIEFISSLLFEKGISGSNHLKQSIEYNDVKHVVPLKKICLQAIHNLLNNNDLFREYHKNDVTDFKREPISGIVKGTDSNTDLSITINCINTVSEDIFNSDIFEENNDQLEIDDDDDDNYDGSANYYEENHSNKNKWLANIQMGELEPCIETTVCGEDDIIHQDDKQHNSVELGKIDLKVEPIDEEFETSFDTATIKVESIDTESEPFFNEPIFKIKTETLNPALTNEESVNSIEERSNSYSADLFETFYNSQNLIFGEVSDNSYQCYTGEKIYSQSTSRIRRQFEPDVNGEVDNFPCNMDLLVPQTTEQAKIRLLHCSSDEESNIRIQDTNKFKKKKGRFKKIAKEPSSNKQSLHQDVSTSTNKMKNKIRQDYIDYEKSGLEDIPLNQIMEKDKQFSKKNMEKEDICNLNKISTEKDINTHIKNHYNEGVDTNIEIQCNNVDSTENVVEKKSRRIIKTKNNKINANNCNVEADILEKGVSVKIHVPEPVLPMLNSSFNENDEIIETADHSIDIQSDSHTKDVIVQNGWECYPIDKKDIKLYQYAYVNLQKLPGSFVDTHLNYINGGINKDVDEIDRLTNLQTLHRSHKRDQSRSRAREIADVTINAELKADGESDIDDEDNELLCEDRLPSADERGDTNECFHPEPRVDSENQLARSWLMNENETESKNTSEVEEIAKGATRSKQDTVKMKDKIGLISDAKNIKEDMEPKNNKVEKIKELPDAEPKVKIKTTLVNDDLTGSSKSKSKNKPTKATKPGPKVKNEEAKKESVLLTADIMMNSDLTQSHTPAATPPELSVTVNENKKKYATRSSTKSHIKDETRTVLIKRDEDSSSEEEKQWVTTKEKLLKRLEKRQENNIDDAKRAKIINEFIGRRSVGPVVRDAFKPRPRRVRSEKKRLERRKQLKVLAREMFGDETTTNSRKSSAVLAKGRRNIRKVIDKKSLARGTVLANMEEFERKQRLAIRQAKLREVLGCEQEVNVVVINDELCLEFDFDTNQPRVTVHPYFTKVMKAHQYEGVKFMWDACFESVESVQRGDGGGGCILAHCMGLGKTLQVLALLHTVLTHPLVAMRRVLVCCPLSTALNWVDEIQKWFAPVTDRIKVFELSKLKKSYERAYQLEDWFNGGGIFIIGYELFRSLSTLDPVLDDVRPTIVNKIRTALLDPGPDMVICDEGHLLKNDLSILAVAMSRVATKRRIVLTGTPMQNNLREYYCMVKFVKPRLLGTYAEYSNRFENPIMNGQHRDSREEDILLMKKRTHILHKVLEGCLQRQEASVLYPYLPKKFEYTVFITLSTCQWDLYKHYMAHYAREHAKQSVLKDFHVLQKIWSHPQVLHNFQTRARQGDWESKVKAEKIEDDLAREDLTACEDVKPSQTDVWWLQYLRGGRMLDDLDSSHKFLVVFRLLDECAALGDKVLIFSTSLFTLDSLEYFLRNINGWTLGQQYYRLDGSVPAEVRQKWCREFNEDTNIETKLFLISTRAGCLGLNMTAANRVIILDTSWNPAHDIQSIFRVYRFGQKKDCYIYRLVALGTMEQKMYERSVTKQAVACRVVDEQQIDRHYNSADLSELYSYDEAGQSVGAGLSAGVRDTALLRVAAGLGERSSALHAVREHDSLLRDSSDTRLPEHERAAAWQQFQQEHETKQMQSLASNTPRKPVQGSSKTSAASVNCGTQPETTRCTRARRGLRRLTDEPNAPSISGGPNLCEDTNTQSSVFQKIRDILIQHQVTATNPEDLEQLVMKVRSFIAAPDKHNVNDPLITSIANVLLQDTDQVAGTDTIITGDTEPETIVCDLDLSNPVNNDKVDPDVKLEHPELVEGFKTTHGEKRRRSRRNSDEEYVPPRHHHSLFSMCQKNRLSIAPVADTESIDSSDDDVGESVNPLRSAGGVSNRTQPIDKVQSESTKRKRGRPRKSETQTSNPHINELDISCPSVDKPPTKLPKRRRGRPSNQELERQIEERQSIASDGIVINDSSNSSHSTIVTLRTREIKRPLDNQDCVDSEKRSGTLDNITVQNNVGRKKVCGAKKMEAEEKSQIHSSEQSDTDAVHCDIEDCILLSDDEDAVPVSAGSEESHNSSRAVTPQPPCPPEAQTPCLPKSLLTDTSFIKIVAHVYVSGNPMLDEDAAVLAAQYSTLKALKQVELTGVEPSSGPLYEIALKVYGKDGLLKLNKTPEERTDQCLSAGAPKHSPVSNDKAKDGPCASKHKEPGTSTAQQTPEQSKAPIRSTKPKFVIIKPKQLVGSSPKPVVESSPKPFVESSPKPVVESSPKPMRGSSPKPVMGSSPKPFVRLTSKPVVGQSPKPFVGALPKLVVKLPPKAVAGQSPKPFAGPLPKLVVKASPKPVVKPTPIGEPTVVPVGLFMSHGNMNMTSFASGSREESILPDDKVHVVDDTDESRPVSSAEDAATPATSSLAREPQSKTNRIDDVNHELTNSQPSTSKTESTRNKRKNAALETPQQPSFTIRNSKLVELGICNNIKSTAASDNCLAAREKESVPPKRVTKDFANGTNLSRNEKLPVKQLTRNDIISLDSDEEDCQPTHLIGVSGNTRDKIDSGNIKAAAKISKTAAPKAIEMKDKKVKEAVTLNSGNKVKEAVTLNSGNKVKEAVTLNSGNKVKEAVTLNSGNKVKEAVTLNSGNNVNNVTPSTTKTDGRSTLITSNIKLNDSSIVKNIDGTAAKRMIRTKPGASTNTAPKPEAIPRKNTTTENCVVGEYLCLVDLTDCDDVDIATTSVPSVTKPFVSTTVTGRSKDILITKAGKLALNTQIHDKQLTTVCLTNEMDSSAKSQTTPQTTGARDNTGKAGSKSVIPKTKVGDVIKIVPSSVPKTAVSSVKRPAPSDPASMPKKKKTESKMLKTLEDFNFDDFDDIVELE